MGRYLFYQILTEVCSGEVKEPFKIKDFPRVLEKDKSFLRNHAIKPGKEFNTKKRNPYFIWVSNGKYRINPKYKVCQ